jgi:hypothetical protein
LRVRHIDADATRVLPDGRLAARHGGRVLTRESPEGHVPEQAVYRVLVEVVSEVGDLGRQQWRGNITCTPLPTHVPPAICARPPWSCCGSRASNPVSFPPTPLWRGGVLLPSAFRAERIVEAETAAAGEEEGHEAGEEDEGQFAIPRSA